MIKSLSQALGCTFHGLERTFQTLEYTFQKLWNKDFSTEKKLL